MTTIFLGLNFLKQLHFGLTNLSISHLTV
uniref:Uncharacterized protein n=1 Tax=Rhizophora mucronata TaxID=61149 RepID=A0A2P2NCY8_RHIMU